MFIMTPGESLVMAKKLIQKTGLEESLVILNQQTPKNILPDELLKWTLAMSACNLTQTMLEDFVAQEIVEEDRQDIIDDYVVESLRHQTIVPILDGADRMEKCQEILARAAGLQVFWENNGENPSPRPRYFCAKEVLIQLGNPLSDSLHDSLYEFMYLQHKYFIDFFRDILKPPLQPGGEVPFR